MKINGVFNIFQGEKGIYDKKFSNFKKYCWRIFARQLGKKLLK